MSKRPPRPWRSYLLGEYTLKLDFARPINPFDHEELTNNEKDRGRLIHMSRGFPTIHPKLEAALDGVSYQRVKECIDILRQSKALNGANLVSALEFYQYEGTRMPDAHPRTIERWLDSCVDILYSMVFRPDNISVNAA